MSIAEKIEWPRNDYSRVPFKLYHDPEVFEVEMERIFRGACWNFMGLEAEVPSPGDYRTTWIGDTPVVYNRTENGDVAAFVNRCAHRGAIVRREVYGNTKDHTCIYHRWCYDLQGNLIGVPFQRGVNGKGGMSDDFDKSEHGLRQLRVENYHGILFVTFKGDEVEPLTDYLGPHHAHHIARLGSRKIKVIGYQRQYIHGNWKFYNENLRDLYHGTLLHEFQTTFAIARMTQEGGSRMDPRHRHNLSWGIEGTDSDEDAKVAYEEANVQDGVLRLKDGSFVGYKPEWEDGITISICSVFPNSCFQQIRNSLATRQIRPKNENEFELFWTIYGYEDDDEQMLHHRNLQANLVGPAGLISMEDGEAVEIVHRATEREGEFHSVVEVGGRGPIDGTESESLCIDIPCRGFWSYYSELMEIEAEGGIR
tara:strand:- start:507 stop:1775 length:1269 start_codon:yes stop_codon:yes gene_type:complete